MFRNQGVSQLAANCGIAIELRNLLRSWTAICPGHVAGNSRVPDRSVAISAVAPTEQRSFGVPENEVAVRYVEEVDIKRLDPDLLSFFNVNTQDDLERAVALAGEE